MALGAVGDHRYLRQPGIGPAFCFLPLWNYAPLFVTPVFPRTWRIVAGERGQHRQPRACVTERKKNSPAACRDGGAKLAPPEAGRRGQDHSFGTFRST